MNPLAGAAIAALVKGGIAGRARQAVGRMTLPAICGMAIALLSLAALAMAMVALWNLLLPAIGAVWTPLAVGGAALAIAIVPGAILYSTVHKTQAAPPPSGDIGDLIAPCLEEAQRFMRDNPNTTLLAAVAAGLAAGMALKD